MMKNVSVIHALLAAALFGASTPFAKLLLGEVSPWLLAGLLNLGSGFGLVLARLLRDRGWKPSGLTAGEWPWLLGAIFFGGVLGPLALMFGLTHTSASTASLLLNLEAVLTAVIAWLVFKENADRRIVFGMLSIVAGGVVLAWPDGQGGATDWLGPLAIVGACLCWAIDNNPTRRVSASDALMGWGVWLHLTEHHEHPMRLRSSDFAGGNVEVYITQIIVFLDERIGGANASIFLQTCVSPCALGAGLCIIRPASRPSRMRGWRNW